ncbi:MAG: hemerythrin domain-containing protein [Pseudomonadota bacterium]
MTSEIAPDAIGFLTADHRKVQALFDEYDRLKEDGSAEQKFEIAKKVCGEILIHMALEEAIFYPIVREKIGDDDLMNEATVEHDSAKELIRQLGEIEPGDEIFDARISVLSEQVEHHVQEEESAMFPKVLLSEIDIAALGKDLNSARIAMRNNLNLPPE